MNIPLCLFSIIFTQENGFRYFLFSSLYEAAFIEKNASRERTGPWTKNFFHFFNHSLLKELIPTERGGKTKKKKKVTSPDSFILNRCITITTK